MLGILLDMFNYVAFRRAGLLSAAPPFVVTPEQLPKCLADYHLHRESVAGMQRCAHDRGAAIGLDSLKNLVQRDTSVRLCESHVGKTICCLKSENWISCPNTSRTTR